MNATDTTSKTKTLILAPHVDDEAIGCWSVLRDPTRVVTVMYFFEVTPQRLDEALSVSHAMNTYVRGANEDISELRNWVKSENFQSVYCPSRQDWHKDHKYVNRYFHDLATHFYSVDMSKGQLLNDAQDKRIFLDHYYPSQKSLWASNAKYWLFEDIREGRDYEIRETVFADAGRLAITVDSSEVRNVHLAGCVNLSEEECLRTLISLGVQGVIEVSAGTGRVIRSHP